METKRVAWQLEALTFDEQQSREVMARFGLAAYYGQCVERQIGLMLASMYNESFFSVSPEAGDQDFDKEFSKTLGRLVGDLGKKVGLPPTLEGRLIQAVKRRNWLMHHYFWDRSSTVYEAHGREEMISELQELADYFRDLDYELVQVYRSWLEGVGVSQENMESEISKLEANAKLRDLARSFGKG